jgi:hypothetical protein
MPFQCSFKKFCRLQVQAHGLSGQQKVLGCLAAPGCSELAQASTRYCAMCNDCAGPCMRRKGTSCMAHLFATKHLMPVVAVPLQPQVQAIKALAIWVYTGNYFVCKCLQCLVEKDALGGLPGLIKHPGVWRGPAFCSW